MMFLFCLIFIGQSIASTTMLYNMTSMQLMAKDSSIKSTPDMMTMSDASTSHISATSDANQQRITTTACHTMPAERSTEVCCAQECDCLTGACSAVLTLFTYTHYAPLFTPVCKIQSPSTLIISKIITSFYRPPILS